MTTSTQIRLASYPDGMPQDSDFETVTVELPELADGQVLLRTIYLSLDPYMRGRMSPAKSYAAPLQPGDVVLGGTVSEVVESRATGLVAGDIVLAASGWQTHAVANADGLRRLDPAQAPVSTAVGVLGMPGFTAYAGLLELGRPRAGETVVVATAAGPVGSAVGQLARIKGARAVGIAGGPEKCRILVETYGFDAALDRRSPTFADDLATATPDGIDVYFETVGGPITEAVVERLNLYARMPVCGLITRYNTSETAAAGPDQLPGFLRRVLTQSLTVRGFIQSEFVPTHYDAFLQDMSGWVRDGRVRYLEDIVDGLDRAPEAFRGLLTGRNVGKMLVRVSADPTRS